jgi:DNA polymerase III epsilon subunit-like protein
MEKEFCWGYVELPEILCTMKLSQSLFPTAFRHNLDILSERFAIPLPEGRHRALPDVIQTAKILLKMLDHGKISSMDELRRRAGLAQMATR